MIYTYLGPSGTFTEAALLQVPDARDSERIPAANVNAALEMVRTGAADAAMVPIENSVEGGVSDHAGCHRHGSRPCRSCARPW